MPVKNHLVTGRPEERIIEKYLYQSLLSYPRLAKVDGSGNTQKTAHHHDTTQQEIWRRLDLAKEYLYTHYDSNINLKQLASHSCLSISHLLRTFKQAYHTTPHQFLIRLRLERAKFLLKDSSYSVKEIAGLVGFGSTSSFIRLFREHNQITPLHYRNTAR